MPNTMPGQSNRWRQALSIALLVGSVAATLIAVTVVISLFWWMSTLSAPKPELVAAPKPPPAGEPVSKPAVAAAEPVSKPAAPAPRGLAPAAHASRPGAAPPPQAAAPEAAPPPIPEPPKPSREPHAQNNHRLAAGLARLGNDPEALRQLRQSQQSPPQ